MSGPLTDDTTFGISSILRTGNGSSSSWDWWNASDVFPCAFKSSTMIARDEIICRNNGHKKQENNIITVLVLKRVPRYNFYTLDYVEDEAQYI